ncbi:MAG TPA: biotin--[acetyl-CoA-carboxylase] ligase [Candidatus Omnitrophota bacterium]|nr:biotin--[acetyl-CoA-carboxylase] ligase [Candidatus Omnitrophota bacterium]
MRAKIIHFLKTAEGYISGEEISHHLKISRAGIWKYIQDLRDEGYDIVAVPHLGYRLVSSPDKLFPSEIQSGLGTKILGKDIRYFDSVASTMDVAFQLGMDGAPEGAVVCAENQTKGKGRRGRSWVSPKSKGIYMSVILRPPMVPADLTRVTLLSAVAVCEAVRKMYRLPVEIKWPNDLLIQKKKLAGILTELSAEMDRVRFVVIGIGINVNAALSQLPPHSTSIRNETGQKVSRADLMQEILRSLEAWYLVLGQEGFIPVIERWKQLSSTLGRQVRLIDPSGDVEGEAVDLDEYGGLVIRSDTGLMVKRMSGDIVQLG